MARAPFQVLVFAYTWVDDEPRYAVLRRADLGVWQAIAGGGEGEETPEQAARREAFEEAGVPADADLLPLKSIGQIPVDHFRDRAHWPPDLTTIPEYSFAVAADPALIRLSAEHDVIAWLCFDDAIARLEWDSNRAALAELHGRVFGTSLQEAGLETTNRDE
ncbi:NUDIX hydrolase [Longimicrobium terrae]|uniref:dATP pyrophosphohydrolase n=1 Tax=Longimicrobium terrae TaxID=1639882 RepID=A0A841GT88_9BACT|nr:NUDIX domain-containing protein [Longimicrobium terrae]MBB4635336.1 dATP pyrophosphohydrolase [Longimicrobium terrae]MBB6069729.1 dATP pyrophosphohydrolase [Longimicrobium terrae]NNC31060.1 NUDIX domain-containing protein [Longimicrobium terrae]